MKIGGKLLGTVYLRNFVEVIVSQGLSLNYGKINYNYENHINLIQNRRE